MFEMGQGASCCVVSVVKQAPTSSSLFLHDFFSSRPEVVFNFEPCV